MTVVDSNLTLEDFDWLRKIRATTDANRDSPAVPRSIAVKLGAFGFAKSDAHGGFSVTERGRGALLEQDMRDAEDR